MRKYDTLLTPREQHAEYLCRADARITRSIEEMRELWLDSPKATFLDFVQDYLTFDRETEEQDL